MPSFVLNELQVAYLLFESWSLWWAKCTDISFGLERFNVVIGPSSLSNNGDNYDG